MTVTSQIRAKLTEVAEKPKLFLESEHDFNAAISNNDDAAAKNCKRLKENALDELAAANAELGYLIGQL